MKSGKLVENIILQALEDIFDNDKFYESVKFFSGEEFYQSARMVGMGYEQMLDMLDVVAMAVAATSRKYTGPRLIGSRRPRMLNAMASTI